MDNHVSEYIAISYFSSLSKKYNIVYEVATIMDVDIDHILTTLGPWKRYQIFQLFYVGVVHMFGVSYVVLIYVFLGRVHVTIFFI